MRTDTLVLPNYDLDSGQAIKAAEYALTDDSYGRLLAQLSERKFDRTSPELRDNILQFYSDLSAPIETKKDQRNWENTLTELDQLRLVTPVALSRGSLPRDSILRFAPAALEADDGGSRAAAIARRKNGRRGMDC